MLKIAAVQLRTGTDVEKNVQAADRLIRKAISKGAKLIVTPEMTSLLDRRPGELEKKIQVEENDFALSHFQRVAQDEQCTLVVGSLPIRDHSGQAVNRSFCIDRNGRVVAKYDKIHMFDVTLPDGQVYRESAKYKSGERAVVAVVDDYKIGMTVCYDMRFPKLYWDLALAGAQIITVPSSFTVPTGQAHWHVLLRARAIETGCFVVAPAQGGHHEDGRDTFGHSVIISPWGEIRAEAGTDPTVIIADVDLAEVTTARANIPNLQNARPFEAPATFS